MSDTTLITKAWRAFEQNNYAVALQLFRQAEQKYGNLFSANINSCLHQLALSTPVLLPCADPLFTNMSVLSDLRPAQRKVIAGIASMPGRVDTLAKVLAKVIPQVDEVHLYLNNFEEVPVFAMHEKVTVYRSQQYGDLRDNGKFFGLQHCDNDSYYFTLDDDLHYPHGYFAALISKIEFYHCKAAVGLHGVIYAKAPRSFFDRLTFNFERELRTDIPVSVVGTGTVGFYTGAIKPTMSVFTETGMADLIFAAYLKANGNAAICTARPAQWLTEYPRTNKSDTIYQQTRADTSRYDRFLTSQIPWGVTSIKSTQPEVSSIAQSFIDWLFQVEQLSSIDIVKSEAVASFRSLFAVCGYPNLSDHYYLAIASSVLTDLLTKVSLTQSDVKAFVDQCQKTYLVESDIVVDEIFIPLIVEELKRYQLGSSSKELALKMTLIHLLQNLANQKQQLNVALHNLLALGDSRLIMGHLDVLLPVTTQKQLIQLVKMLILDGESVPEVLLNILRTMPQDSSALMFINCFLLLSQRNVHADAAIVAFTMSHFPDDVKLGYLKELLSFYADSGMRPTCENYAVIAQNPDLKPAIKRLFAQLLLTTEAATDKIIADSFKTLIATNDLPFEAVLWHAEFNYQQSGDVSFVVNAINQSFISCGLQPVTHSNVGDSNFLRALQADVQKQAESYGQCSVVIAAYEAEATLQYAYDSICQQSYKDLQIIVVDDCSEHPVTDYLILNPAVSTQIIRNSHNLGPYGCRNVALEVATGKYFMVHDGDDWAHPEKIEQQIHSLQDDAVVCSFSRHIRVSQHGHLKLENHGHFVGHGPMTSMFRMRVFSELGPFDEVPTRGDMEFKSRIKHYYGEQAIYEDQRLMLISLDWHSNSKKKTATVAKKVHLAGYKNNYTSWQRLVPFWRKPEKQDD